jgi:hypothetical protein
MIARPLHKIVGNDMILAGHTDGTGAAAVLPRSAVFILLLDPESLSLEALAKPAANGFGSDRISEQTADLVASVTRSV